MDALLQLGDAAWYGRGARRNWRKAARLYEAASRARAPHAQAQAQALFNLGFMHEFGAGRPQVRDWWLCARNVVISTTAVVDGKDLQSTSGAFGCTCSGRVHALIACRQV